MPTRTSPFDELERFFTEMNRELNERMSDDTPSWLFADDAMAIDLVEHDDEFVATVDLPGFEKDDVDVVVTDHTLRISAEREAEDEREDETYIRRERRHATARRSVRLPDDVDAENVHARMRNGVLTVTLPRLHAEADRRVEVE